MAIPRLVEEAGWLPSLTNVAVGPSYPSVIGLHTWIADDSL